MPNPSVPPAGPDFVTVRGGYRVSFQPDAPNARCWRVDGAGSYKSLYTLADAYSLDFWEVWALMALVDGPAALPPSAGAPKERELLATMKRIAYGCSFPSSETMRAIRDTARAAIKQYEEAALRPSADAAPVTSGETETAKLAVRGFPALLREELSLNTPEGGEEHLRCTCDDCVEAVRKPLADAYKELAEAAHYLPIVKGAMPGGEFVGAVVVARFEKAMHALHVLVSAWRDPAAASESGRQS